ncbi:hypothetical protein D918_03182 [Trichuris suis]|nr:hypothetical protein D918_03182 [Trichuris suis]
MSANLNLIILVNWLKEFGSRLVRPAAAARRANWLVFAIALVFQNVCHFSLFIVLSTFLHSQATKEAFLFYRQFNACLQVRLFR